MKKQILALLILLLTSTAWAGTHTFNEHVTGSSAATTQSQALIWAYDDAWDAYQDKKSEYENHPNWTNVSVSYLNSSTSAQEEDGIWWGSSWILFKVTYTDNE